MLTNLDGLLDFAVKLGNVVGQSDNVQGLDISFQLSGGLGNLFKNSNAFSHISNLGDLDSLGTTVSGGGLNGGQSLGQ